MESCLEELAVAIGRVRARELGTPAEVGALLAVWDLLAAEVCAAVGRLDRSGAVVVEGSVNTVQWLRTQGGRTQRDAGALVKRARLLAACPVLGAAWAGGGLTGGQVEVVAAKLGDDRLPLFVEHAPELVPALAGLSVRQTAMAMSSPLLPGSRGDGVDEPGEPARCACGGDARGSGCRCGPGLERCDARSGDGGGVVV
jgi:hypothetical protein